MKTSTANTRPRPVRARAVPAAKRASPSAPSMAPAPAGFTLVKTRRAFEEVTAQVRALLFDGSLRPGDRMPPERELCQMLGVGRPALREALRSLEAGGLIELRKGKTGGAFICTGNHRAVSGGMSDMLRLGNVSLEQMFEAREWILSALVRPACRRITPQEIEKLRENVEMAERLHGEGRYDERIDCNFEFHSLLAEASRNPVAAAVIRGLMDALRSVISAIGSELPPRFFENRRALVKALGERDEEAAARLTSTIVRTSAEIYKRLERERVQKPAVAKAAVRAVKPAAAKKSPAPAKRATGK